VRLLVLVALSLAGAGGLSIGLSSEQPAARPVMLKLKFTSVLQCGLPIGPPLAVTLPAAERVPQKVAADAVLVNGKAAESVTVSSHVVTVKVARPEVVCTVISRGPVTVRFARAANLGNPAQPGTYRVVIHRGTQTVSGTFTVVR
jgi:hypothetical protein